MKPFLKELGITALAFLIFVGSATIPLVLLDPRHFWDLLASTAKVWLSLLMAMSLFHIAFKVPQIQKFLQSRLPWILVFFRQRVLPNIWSIGIFLAILSLAAGFLFAR